MMKKFVSTTVALALALSASVALAGTYVSGALPSEFGGGYIPPNPAILKNVQKASKEGAKLAASVEKCYSKGAANYSKGKAPGVGTCLNDPAKGVVPKYTAKINGIAAKAPGLPSCHNYVADGSLIAGLVKGFNGSTYCQSPSGAFVDGTSSL
ncbi:hypothetical protein K2Z84_18240 [Candidatus Binatia bacterium]|nr:hypothetical protein [Candidatus Binatia bacterium]